MTRIALIPSYEPEEQLSQVIKDALEQDFWIVVVDDGSQKECRKRFEQLEQSGYGRVQVLHHMKNRGKGAAIKTGLSFLKSKSLKDAVIVTIDGDGQHRIRDAVRVCDEAEKHPGTLVLGSRGFQAGVPLRSRIGNFVTRHLFRLFTGLNISDTQTGLRAFTGELLDFMLEGKGERYEYEMQVLLGCRRMGIPVAEIPIETIYLDANSQSHFQMLRDSFLIYRELMGFMVVSFISFFVDYSSYCLFLFLLSGVWGEMSVAASNVMARLVSGSLNYCLNRRFVFNSRGSLPKTAGLYILLAAGILFLNTTILNLLVIRFETNRYLAKAAAEVMLFLLSWSVQKLLIFRTSGGEA